MAQFQDSGFFGFSGKTLWVSLAVTGVVVGLFFIPGTVKFLMSSRANGSKAPAQQAQSVVATTKVNSAAEQNVSTARGSLSPVALRNISETLKEGANQPAPASASVGNKAPVGSKKSEASESKGEGMFAGWDFKVKAGLGSSTGGTIPSGVAMDRLSSKETQRFFQRSRGALIKFGARNFAKGARGNTAVLQYVAIVDEVANGVAKGSQEEKDLPALLKNQHVATLRGMASAGADRGVLLDWLMIPVVSFVDGGTGVNAQGKLLEVFAPRVVLRSVNIKQKRERFGRYPVKPQARLKAEVAVKGSDVSFVSVVSGGRTLREVRPPRADMNGYRIFRVTGDATGVWSFVVNDKYGGPAYRKSYTFYPRVYRFRQKRDGTYDVAFRPGTASNSLDKYFFLGAAGGAAPGAAGGGPALSRF
jgi:hypothetical protein